MSTHTPERLNLWDRMFNRYRREVIEQGEHMWQRNVYGSKIPGSEYGRVYVKYRVIDRLTGSERIELEYLS